jgi:hypothetical protein
MPIGGGFVAMTDGTWLTWATASQANIEIKIVANVFTNAPPR